MLRQSKTTTLYDLIEALTGGDETAEKDVAVLVQLINGSKCVLRDAEGFWVGRIIVD